jgi:hypothetical protein
LFAKSANFVDVIDNHNGASHRAQAKDVPLRLVKLAILEHLQANIRQERESLNNIRLLKFQPSLNWRSFQSQPSDENRNNTFKDSIEQYLEHRRWVREK